MITGFLCKGKFCNGEVVHSSILKIELRRKEHDEVYTTFAEYHLCQECAEELVITYHGQEDIKVKTSVWKQVEHKMSKMGR